MRKDDIPCCQPTFWMFVVICSVLLLFASITSGLALGLLSFSQVDLEVLIKAGKPQAKKNAAKVKPVVKNEHLLLCTLLTGKSLALAALPIFMDSVLPPWTSILLSMALVLVLVEIIPQALCARHGLSLGAKLAAFVSLLQVVFFPISYPVSKLLDWFLGKGHSSLLRRAELKTLVDLHANEAGRGGELLHHETSIITGALDLTEKTSKDAMTPISETFSLDICSKLDMKTMGLIMSKGHSRIPIYSGYPTNIVGVLLVKNLIFCRPEEETPIKYMAIRRIPRVHENLPLYDVMNIFEKSHSHMAVVIKRKEDTKSPANSGIGNPSLFTISTNSSSYTEPAELRGLPSINEKEYLCVSTDTSSRFSTDTEYYSATMTNFMEQHENLLPQIGRREGGDGTILWELLASHPHNLDEEVIGIITMEDVMEEILQILTSFIRRGTRFFKRHVLSQNKLHFKEKHSNSYRASDSVAIKRRTKNLREEDIVDETDEYVDVHDRIRINPLPLRRSASRSSSRSASNITWKTPEPSPFIFNALANSLPGYAATAIRPTLYASPEKTMVHSPPQVLLTADHAPSEYAKISTVE